MEGFNELEMLKIAKGIEEEGYRFYTEAMGRFQEEEIKDIFHHLAEEEKAHVALFQRIYDQTIAKGDKQENYLYDEEVASYIKAISETAIFNTNGLTNAQVRRVETAKDALLIGMQAEKDAILFYETLLKNTKVESTKKILMDLVHEEMRHLYKLKAFIEGMN